MEKIMEFDLDKKYIVYTENVLNSSEFEELKKLIYNFLYKSESKVLLLNGVKIVAIELKEQNEQKTSN